MQKSINKEQEKTETEKNIVFEQKLNRAIDYYEINSAFINDKNTVIKIAIRFLKKYDVDTKFAEEPERNLFLLAIVDAWISTSSLKEKKSLLCIFKLVVTGLNEQKQFSSFSQRIRTFSQQKRALGEKFDPQAKQNNHHTLFIDRLIEYISDSVSNIDEIKTRKAHQILTNWSESSLLQKVRKTLGIESPEKEYPVSIKILKITSQEMTEQLGDSALFLTYSGNRYIILANDYQTRSLEHEYTHSQSTGIASGYKGLLFLGLNEALTENAISSPTNYTLDRNFLIKLLQIHPEYEDLLYKAYRGNKDARKKIFSLLVNDYGLVGFLNLARMTASCPVYVDIQFRSIFIFPDLYLIETDINAAKKMGELRQKALETHQNYYNNNNEPAACFSKSEIFNFLESQYGEENEYEYFEIEELREGGLIVNIYNTQDKPQDGFTRQIVFDENGRLLQDVSPRMMVKNEYDTEGYLIQIELINVSGAGSITNISWEKNKKRAFTSQITTQFYEEAEIKEAPYIKGKKQGNAIVSTFQK